MDKWKTAAIVSVVACVVLAAGMIAMYFSFTGLVQQQSDLIEDQGDQIRSYKEALDSVKEDINDLWSNITRDFPEIATNLTAQNAYFRPLD